MKMSAGSALATVLKHIYYSSHHLPLFIYELLLSLLLAAKLFIVNLEDTYPPIVHLRNVEPAL